MENKEYNREEIDKVLADLKANNKSMLECIGFLKMNYNLPLLECRDIVIDSKVWAAERAEFLKNIDTDL